MYRERLSTSNQEMHGSKISDLIPQVVCCIVAHIGICIICICVLLCCVHSYLSKKMLCTFPKQQLFFLFLLVTLAFKLIIHGLTNSFKSLS